MGVIIVVFVVLVQCFVYNNATDISVCVHNVTGDRECCNDYRNVSGKCEKCIGLFGKNCTSECSYGYYGHGCRYKCNCTEQFQICDSKYGCIESVATYDWKTNSSSVSNSYEYETNGPLLAFCGFIVLLLLGFIIYFYHKLRKQNKRNMASERSSANIGEQLDIQEDRVYTDKREPRIHDPSRNFDLPTYFFDNTEPNRMDTAKNKISSQVRLPSTRPETLDSNIYEYCNRLNSPSSSPIYSRVMKHDNDLTSINSSESQSSQN